ncbi:MAG: cytochrome c [Janthinobacterium lividum]
MKRSNVVWLSLSGVVALAAAASFALAWAPALAPVATPAPDAFPRDLRAAGARVVALGDCMVCHTAEGGAPFAGGVPLKTPFGTIYATNITPDRATGMGTWSLAAFTRALREGRSRDGTLLYPAFPYVHFTRMSDADIQAAYAYLMSRTPVRATAPANHLIFPLGWRPLLAFWNVLFLAPGPRAADVARDMPPGSRDVGEGRYLADAPGHCAACHTPLNVLGAERADHAFEGGVIEGWDAPPLNALAQGDRPWTVAQLTGYLRTGSDSEHGAAAGPMRAVTRDLARVPEADVRRMAVYFLSLHAPRPAVLPVPAVGAAPATPTLDASVARGRTLFTASCAICHGAGAPMQTIGLRPALDRSGDVRAESPRNAIQVILQGIAWQRAEATDYMPAFAQTYDDRQVADIANYVRATYSTQPAWNATEKSVAALRGKD